MIRVIIDGISYTGWTSAVVQRSLNALSGSFEISLVDTQSGKDWRFATQKKCDIYIDLYKIMTGYIDSVSISVSPDAHEVVIRGRDITSDLIDSACVLDKKGNLFTQALRNKNIFEIAKKLCGPFTIVPRISTDTGKKFSAFAIIPGETVFEALDRAAKQRGVILTTDEDGSLLITKTGSSQTNDSLKYGVNVLDASGSYDFTNRFHFYRTDVGAGSQLWGKVISSKYEDREVARTARTMVVSSTSDDKKRAAMEALYRAAASQSFDVTTAGWVQTNNIPWECNQLVAVDIPPLYLRDTLLITGVAFNLSADEGSKTILTLERKDSFDGARAIAADSLKSQKGIGLWAG
jgi:prophage tail gpP-like protein